MHFVRLRRADLPGKRRDAPGSVAAHLGLRPVGIEELHPEVEPVRRLYEDDPFAADAGAARADRRQDLAPAGERAVPIIDQNEVVSRAVHLGESDPHQYHQPLISGTSSPSVRRMRSISTL